MAKRFNAPPDWPIPAGWSPPQDWVPDPAWPPAPAGWSFWVDEKPVEPPQPVAGYAPSYSAQSPPAPNYAAPAAYPAIGYPASYGPRVYPYAAPAASETNWRDRISPPAQALISAALLLPTPLGYLISFRGSFWPTWATYLVLDLWLVLVVAVWGRTTGRRVAAAGVAVAGLLVDRGTNAVFGVLDLPGGLAKWSFWISYALSMVLFVAAWGLARRRRATWALGLIPTFLLSVGALWYYNSEASWDSGWFTYWVVDVIAVFTVGCLLCWAVELLGRAGKPTATPLYTAPS